MNKNIKSILYCLFCMISTNCLSQQLNISSNFPSGNLTIDKMRNDTIWIRPDLRDTQGDWFYWHFEVQHAKGKTLTFIFPSETEKPRMQYLTAKGPALSFDGGKTWKWLNPDADWKRSFSYTFRTHKPVRFSMSMPYTRTHFLKFIKPYLKSNNVKLDTLVLSEGGRVVDRLFLKPTKAAPKHKIFITARHHACEMNANYMIEGMVAEALKDEWMRNNVEICIIPFVDIDGVENGDQGKNRNGHDHNRDYAGVSKYASIRAIRQWIPTWADKKLAITLDIHGPWIRFGIDDRIHFLAYETYLPKATVKKIKQFHTLVQQNNIGELKVSNNFYVAESESSILGKPASRNWFTANAKEFGVQVPLTIEFPYATNNGQTITQQNARTFGKDIARALKAYLVNYSD